MIEINKAVYQPIFYRTKIIACLNNNLYRPFRMSVLLFVATIHVALIGSVKQ